MPRTTESNYTYEAARYRAKRRVRQAKRAKRRARYAQPLAISTGVRPLSTFHPEHPLRRFGPHDDRNLKRDRALWA